MIATIHSYFLCLLGIVDLFSLLHHSLFCFWSMVDPFEEEILIGIHLIVCCSPYTVVTDYVWEVNYSYQIVFSYIGIHQMVLSLSILE